MIKSELIKNEKEKETKSYPYIGVLKDSTSKIYVLFLCPKTGTCINSDNAVWNIGAHINHWSEHNFEKTDSSTIIQLSNK